MCRTPCLPLVVVAAQADLLELGEQKQQLTTDLDDLWIRVDEQMSWSEHCEQVSTVEREVQLSQHQPRCLCIL